MKEMKCSYSFNSDYLIEKLGKLNLWKMQFFIRHISYY